MDKIKTLHELLNYAESNYFVNKQMEIYKNDLFDKRTKTAEFILLCRNTCNEFFKSKNITELNEDTIQIILSFTLALIHE